MNASGRIQRCAGRVLLVCVIVYATIGLMAALSAVGEPSLPPAARTAVERELEPREDDQ